MNRITRGLMMITVASLAGCGGLAHRVEKAHGFERWRGRQAVAADITVTFGGKKMVDGRFTFDTPVGKARAEMVDGTVMVFDGQQAWVLPGPKGSSGMMGARFHLLTWPYFMAAPMKLRDPGAHLARLPDARFNGKPHRRAKLTFDAGVGDAPDDWYILYVDPDTHWLRAMSYIVTYSKSAREAEKEPHAIVYDGFVKFNGITLAQRWKFHHWNETDGIHGKPLGEATVSRIRFVNPATDTFVKPEGAHEDKLPGT